MRKRILVVEDEPDIVRLLRIIFDSASHVVLSAADIATARATLEQLRAPDLVVLDLVLPDGNGIEFCRELKATRPAVPILVLTARAQQRAREEALAAGADLFMTKPFDVEVLEAVVARLLAAGAGSDSGSAASA